MTTINGVTFNMVNLRPVAVHRNSISEQPGSDTNFITDMGYDGLVLRLEGFEETLATYDSVISEFMKSGEQTLVHRTGWQFKVYSVQLTPELIEGIVDNFFPYDLILYTSTPYRESTALSCRAKAITANNQEWSAEDMPCDNLLDNWSMEDWSAGTTSAPDGWVQSSGTILKETSIVKVGSASARITPAYANLYQEISFPTKYRGSVLTFGCWVYSTAGNNSYLRIQDSAGYSNSAFHNSPSAWQWKTVSRTIDSAATFVRVHCSMDSTNITAYYDGAVLIEGDSIPDNTFIRDIDTDGSVDAVPDIQVTNSLTLLSVDTTYDSPGTLPAITGLTWDGSNIWSSNNIEDEIYKHNADMTVSNTYSSPANSVSGLTWDGTYIWSTDIVASKIYKHNADMTVHTQYNSPSTGSNGLAWDGTYIWSTDTVTNKIYKHNTDMTVNTSYDTPGSTDLSGLTWARGHLWGISRVTDKIYIFDSTCTVIDDFATPDTSGEGLAWDGTHIWSGDFTIDKIIKHNAFVLKDVQVYNTADSTVKCIVANDILMGGIHRINTDGTGTIEYNDNFSSIKWILNSTNLNVTQDTSNHEIDIADDGYIYWLMDTKGPVTGIPTLTAQINITTGTPTIQISTDGSTWYDITTAIVDDVNTVYELDSSSLHLKGQTAFYWRFDCVKAGAATCSIKSFELDINIVTIDFEHPKITAGGTASTCRCDQDSDSGIDCTVALYYRGRSWPA